MPLSPEATPKSSIVVSNTTAAIGVRPSDGKLVACNSGPAEVEFELAGSGTLVSPDGSIDITGADIQVATAVRTEITDAQADATTAIADASDALTAAADAQATADAAIPQTRTYTAGAGMTGGGDGTANRTFDVVADADGSMVVAADSIKVGVLATDAQHGNRGGGGIHADVTTSVAGFMSAADKVKLNDITYAYKGALFFSPITWLVAQTTPVVLGGNFTTGVSFQVTQSVVCSGIYFYWAGAVSRTIKCVLRNGAGTTLASIDVAVSGAGFYTGTFSSPQTIAPADATGTTSFKASIWENSATEYARWATAPALLPAQPFVGGPKVIWENFKKFAAGDANPTSTSGAEHYPVEPIFV
jgi:hypothetical protein